jgi:SOS response regulatory protein OraA/RecX
MRRQGATGAGAAPAAPVDPDSSTAAEQTALRILAGAAQSASSLRRRLQRRGFSEDAAAAATTALTLLGYVDDTALASSISARRQRSGHGRIRVAAELHARGLNDTAISATLAGMDGDAERASALRLGRQLAERASRDITDRQGRQRLGGALQRRGFDTETVGWVLRELEREP